MKTNKNFMIEIDKFVLNTEPRILDVLRTALSSVIEEAQTPVAEGGRMRVDTGFLRSSGIASINRLPAGPGRGRTRKPGELGKPLSDYPWAGEPINVALARLRIGDVFYFGWTAKYAKYREVYDGFLGSAAQKWQQHINAATAKFKDKDEK